MTLLSVCDVFRSSHQSVAIKRLQIKFRETGVFDWFFFEKSQKLRISGVEKDRITTFLVL